ncbi:MAG TPA: hypothetical protein PKB02_00830 [Anaerohalosphaeraceae bacterium]|nr:hypothetical protein [Anaerohalosphaeraceae bacterium]
MSTEKQLAANRLNAQKSTGPKTPQGKARVAANAVTHGLTAACPVLASEDPGAYARFRTGMTARLAPAGDIETLLADRVINLAWRLQRAQNYESYVLDNLIRSAADNPAPDISASSDASAECHSPQEPAPAKSKGGNPELLTSADNASICHSRGEPAPAKAWGGNPASSETVSTILAQILLDDFTGPQVLEKLQRYESRIERGFYKALKELQTTQSLNPMISPGKDNPNLYSHRGIAESSQRSGPARPGLTVEHSASVAGASSFGINQHPSQTDSALNPAHHANPVKSSKPEVTKTITLPDHLAFQSSLDNPQSPIFSSVVLNKLLQNKPNSGESRVSAM